MGMTSLAALFPDGAGARALELGLPAGRLVRPYAQTYTDFGLPPVERPVYWLSDAPASADLWRRLRAAHAASGLWPLLLVPGTFGNPDVPWTAGDVIPESVAEIDRCDAAEFMRAEWDEWAAEEEGEEDIGYDFEDLEPFGRTCPGLAAPGASAHAPDDVADWCAGEFDDGKARIGLVAAARSADTLAIIGWQGPINHHPPSPLSAMLRSWEDRFGVRVVRVGFDTLDVSVAAPPVTEEHALHVAAEHFAFCPDNIQQGPDSLREYAKAIQGVNSWSFWWD